MSPTSGVFTVQEDGVYQFTFTGFIVALKGHMVGDENSWILIKNNQNILHQISADIYLRRGNKSTVLGRGSAKSDENGFGVDDDLHSTLSIVLQERIKKGDKIQVTMIVHGDHGSSKIDSDFSRKIIFTGMKISD